MTKIKIQSEVDAKEAISDVGGSQACGPAVAFEVLEEVCSGSGWPALPASGMIVDALPKFLGIRDADAAAALRMVAERCPMALKGVASEKLARAFIRR